MSELKAGRELDALIAEKVMGEPPMLSWQVLSPDEKSSCLGGTKDECERWLAEHARNFPYSVYAGYHVGAWRRYARYSTDISAAWRVVEKMHEQGFAFFRVEADTPPNTRVQEWIAGFHRKGEQTAYWKGADTAPLAICLAALNATTQC